MGPLLRTDRRLGAAARAAAARAPGGPAAARAGAATLGPGFRTAVAVLVARRATRATGLEALAAGAAAALLARALRDRLARARPGARPDGGFPSRHASAAAAIAASVGRSRPRAGRALACAAAAGLAGRVATGEHEPGDILAGIALGLAVDRAVVRPIAHRLR